MSQGRPAPVGGGARGHRPRAQVSRGIDLGALGQPDLGAIDKGIANLERHLNNLRSHHGLPTVIAINRFAEDTDDEIDLIRRRMAHHGAPVVIADHWARGGAGAEDLARTVVELATSGAADLRFLYDDDVPLWSKMKAVATKIYGASEITADTKVRDKIKKLQERGFGRYPVCVAKTQYSFSTDPLLRGAPSGHASTSARSGSPPAPSSS